MHTGRLTRAAGDVATVAMKPRLVLAGVMALCDRFVLATRDPLAGRQTAVTSPACEPLNVKTPALVLTDKSQGILRACLSRWFPLSCLGNRSCYSRGGVYPGLLQEARSTHRRWAALLLAGKFVLVVWLERPRLAAMRLSIADPVVADRRWFVTARVALSAVERELPTLLHHTHTGMDQVLT